jgi:predicted GNAT family N-acyltransferase
MSNLPAPTFREIALDSDEHRAALRLRAAVLRAPLGLDWTEADQADEPVCIHLAGFIGDRLVATLLLKPLDAAMVKMRQVAVEPERQGTGLGAVLVGFAEAQARERGFSRMMAHARGTALPFYERLGYTTEGDDFLENTIPHRRVTKTLR